MLRVLVNIEKFNAKELIWVYDHGGTKEKHEPAKAAYQCSVCKYEYSQTHKTHRLFLRIEKRLGENPKLVVGEKIKFIANEEMQKKFSSLVFVT